MQVTFQDVNYLIKLDDIQLLNEAQQDAGVLHTTISYDRVSHFEG